MRDYDKMKLTEIAKAIGEHLARFEKDPKTNPPDPLHKTRPYYCAGVYRGGSRVFVRYIAYQGSVSIKKKDAITYLKWLDEGNVGKHYEVLGRIGSR